MEWFAVRTEASFKYISFKYMHARTHTYTHTFTIRLRERKGGVKRESEAELGGEEDVQSPTLKHIHTQT